MSIVTGPSPGHSFRPEGSRRIRAFGVVLGSIVAAFAFAPSSALAQGSGVGATANPSLKQSVFVGEQGVPVSVRFGPITVGPDYATDTFQFTAIRYVAGCNNLNQAGSNTQAPCPERSPGVSGYDSGVFASSPTGTGSVLCAGTTWTIGAPNPTTGAQLLTPNVPILLKDGEQCLVSWTVDVLKLPTVDNMPNIAGIQTGARASSEMVDVSAGPGLGLTGGGLGTAGTAIFPATTGPPTVTPPVATPPVVTPPPVKPPKKTKNPSPKTLTSRFFRCEKPEAPFTGRGVTRKAGNAEIKISGSGGACAGKTFTATVSGRKIESVKFYIDNKLVEKDTKAPFQLEIDTRDYEVGSHQLKTTVSFAKKG